MLWIIWLIFALLFLVLSYYHWRTSNKNLSPFQMKVRPLSQPDSPIRATIKIGGTDIDAPLNAFIGDFNSYLDGYNKASRRQNRIQACGYLLASLTAIYSIVITI
jgi:hypothetical protein